MTRLMTRGVENTEEETVEDYSVEYCRLEARIQLLVSSVQG
jgi:hypothetical protein